MRKVAVLSDADRAKVTARYMQRLSDDRQTCHSAILKAVIRSSVNAVDDWCDSAATGIPATSYNAALPTAFRNNATAKQKALMLLMVVDERHEVTS